MYRKFLNFMVTYKRIKKRNKTSGEAATTWDFYDRWDKIYGCRSDISISECTLESSIDALVEDLTCDSNEPCGSYLAPTDHECSPPPRKRDRADVVEFLRSESVADRKLLEEILNCEKEKIKIEKDKIEKISQLREALKSGRD